LEISYWVLVTGCWLRRAEDQEQRLVSPICFFFHATLRSLKGMPSTLRISPFHQFTLSPFCSMSIRPLVSSPTLQKVITYSFSFSGLLFSMPRSTGILSDHLHFENRQLPTFQGIPLFLAVPLIRMLSS